MAKKWVFIFYSLKGFQSLSLAFNSTSFSLVAMAKPKGDWNLSLSFMVDQREAPRHQGDWENQIILLIFMMLNNLFVFLLLSFRFELWRQGEHLMGFLVGVGGWGGRWIKSIIKVWGYSQRGSFLDPAEDSIAVDDTVELSLEHPLSWSCVSYSFYKKGSDLPLGSQGLVCSTWLLTIVQSLTAKQQGHID